MWLPEEQSVLWMKFMTTEEFRPCTELLTAFQKSKGREPCVEEEESNSRKETCAHIVTSRHGKKEACANNLSNPPSGSLFKKTIIPTNERKWIVIDANPWHRGALSVQGSKMVTKMVRHHDQDDREQDGSYHWDTVRSVLLKAFARYGAQQFPEDHWIRLIHEGSSTKRIEFCVDHKNSLCYLRAIQGHPCGI